MSEAGWRAVGAGVLAGAPVLVPLALAQLLIVVLADDPSDAWAFPLLALLLFAFGRAGARAATRGGEGDRPMLLAALAALGVFLVWVPVRVAIWAGGGEGNPAGALGAGLLMTVLAGVVGAYMVGRREEQAG